MCLFTELSKMGSFTQLKEKYAIAYVGETLIVCCEAAGRTFCTLDELAVIVHLERDVVLI